MSDSSIWNPFAQGFWDTKNMPMWLYIAGVVGFIMLIVVIVSKKGGGESGMSEMLPFLLLSKRRQNTAPRPGMPPHPGMRPPPRRM